MKLFSKEFFQSHQKPYKYDVFIFFQRSQRNCEPEKRSLAGAWRRHLSWPTSLNRKFCQKSILIWFRIHVVTWRVVVTNIKIKYQTENLNCHHFISCFFYRQWHGIMITLCPSTIWTFFMRTTQPSKLGFKVQLKGLWRSWSCSSLFACSKEQCCVYGWFGWLISSPK